MVRNLCCFWTFFIVLPAVTITSRASPLLASPRGKELTHLRNQFSRTFYLGNNRFITQIFTQPVHHLNNEGIWMPIMAESTRRAYPQNDSFWTGNVRTRNNNYEKNSGDIIANSQPQSASQWWYQGWFKFNLSSIPDDAIIDTVSINYYCYEATNGPSTYLRLLLGDPVPQTPQTLWNWITTGPTVTYAQTHGTGWITRTLNATGKAAVDSCLNQNWIAFGLHEWTNRTGAILKTYGTGTGQYTPYLEIAYNLPARTDISAEEVLEPIGTVNAGTVVVPTGRWRNRQPHPDNYYAWFIFINPAGQRTALPGKLVEGHPGLSDTILFFNPFPLNDTGRWTVKCSTYADGDINPDNDVILRFFRVIPGGSGSNFDVAVTEIVSPIGVFDTNATITPQARWKNNSANPATFFAYVGITNPDGIRVYTNSVAIANLPAGVETTAIFSPFNVNKDTGNWTVCCSTVAIGDTYPANDWRLGVFAVYEGGNPRRGGWHEVTSMPLAPSGKAVKDGGWLTFDQNSGLLFAAKGNKTGDFYCYDPQADTWHERNFWPGGIEGKGPAKGAIGVADGYGRIFAVKGNNTRGFWCYYYEGDSWRQLPDVPLGPSNKKVKGGSDILYLEQQGVPYVYLLKGYKNEFYRFNLVTDSWEMLPEAPQSVNPKWDKGSWLVYDGNQYIYAHKAKYHELWRFNLYTNTWDTNRLSGMPFLSRTGKNKKAKDGSSATYRNGSIYALKGGNTCEFYRYDIAGDTWTELEPMPEIGSTGRKKKVKGGGDITSYSTDLIFALKGNKTRELWYYSAVTLNSPGSLRKGITTTPTASPIANFQLYPNPCAQNEICIQYTGTRPNSSSILVYDATGAVRIKHHTTILPGHPEHLNIAQLPNGIYWVKLTGTAPMGAKKLIVNR